MVEVGQRYVLMANGGQSVVECGMTQMLESFVDSLDIQQVSNSITHQLRTIIIMDSFGPSYWSPEHHVPLHGLIPIIVGRSEFQTVIGACRHHGLILIQWWIQKQFVGFGRTTLPRRLTQHSYLPRSLHHYVCSLYTKF